jgi:adenylyltransferase/sulfurtransferase
MKRYVRNIAVDQIDIEGQEKINNATALVVGAGGLGSHLLFHLASLGFGNVIVMDDDTVSISNLQRQILFNEKSVGFSKAKEACNTLCRYNSEIAFYPKNKKFTNLKELIEDNKFDIDIIFDCTDSYDARVNISKEAQKYNNIPVVFASVVEMEGWVFTQNYKTDIHFEDFMHPHPNDANCDSFGVLSPSVAFVSSIQAMEGLKMILNLEDKKDRVLNINCFNYQVHEMEF